MGEQPKIFPEIFLNFLSSFFGWESGFFFLKSTTYSFEVGVPELTLKYSGGSVCVCVLNWELFPYSFTFAN